MQKFISIFIFYLITINLSLQQKNNYDYNQEIKAHSLHQDNLYKLSEVISNKQKRIKRKTNHSNPNKMYYPDEIFLSSRTSKNCSFGLCEEIDNYPSDKIQKIISRSLDIQKYFADQPPAIDIFTRFSEEGENLCPTRLHSVFPKSAMNIHGVEQLLVNVGEYKQGVNFETCMNAGKPCKFTEIFPDGYSTTCQQKFTVRRLMAIGKDSDQPIFDNFQMPSCCVCTFKKNN